MRENNLNVSPIKWAQIKKGEKYFMVSQDMEPNINMVGIAEVWEQSPYGTRLEVTWENGQFTNDYEINMGESGWQLYNMTAENWVQISMHMPQVLNLKY